MIIVYLLFYYSYHYDRDSSAKNPSLSSALSRRPAEPPSTSWIGPKPLWTPVVVWDDAPRAGVCRLDASTQKGGNNEPAQTSGY